MRPTSTGSEARLTAYDTGKDFTSDGMRNVADSEVESPTGHHDVVDARFPERWLNDKRITRLSGEAFKLFMFAMGWSVANKTDGALTEDDLEDVPRVDRSLSVDLEKAGLWRRQGNGWMITVFDGTQTPRAQLEALEAKRLHERDRAQRYRDRKKADPDAGGRHADDARDDIRTGQDRTGVEGEELLQQRDDDEVRSAAAPVGAGFDLAGDRNSSIEWPVAAVPGQRRDPDPPSPPPSFAILGRMKAEADRT